MTAATVARDAVQCDQCGAIGSHLRGCEAGELRGAGVGLKTKKPPARWQFKHARKVVRERSGGACEAPEWAYTTASGRVRPVRCQTTATEVHHIRPRSLGGNHHPDNLLDLCCTCHRHVHAYPADAHTAGLLDINSQTNQGETP